MFFEDPEEMDRVATDSRPYEGHRATELWAAISISPNGDEGLAKLAAVQEDGTHLYLTLAATHPQMLETMRPVAAELAERGERNIEWRHFIAAPDGQ